MRSLISSSTNTYIGTCQILISSFLIEMKHGQQMIDHNDHRTTEKVDLFMNDDIN